jgi:hypothetical protein
MSGVIGALEQAVLSNPLDVLIEDEIETELLKFSSFCSIIHNKKLNNVTVFSLIVKNKIYKKIYMRMIQVENEKEAIMLFLRYNSNLCRSKVVKEVLQS